VTAGKEGRICPINRGSLGQYNSSVGNVVQEQLSIGAFFSTPVFWNNTLYFAGSADHAKAFSFSSGRISNNPTTQSVEKYPRMGTAAMVVSANGQNQWHSLGGTAWRKRFAQRGAEGVRRD
jgi:hypothetical protein